MGKATWVALACLAFLVAASAVTLDKVAEDSFDFNYQGIDPYVRVPWSACRRTRIYKSAHFQSPFAIMQRHLCHHSRTQASPIFAAIPMGALGLRTLKKRPHRTRIPKASGLWFSN